MKKRIRVLSLIMTLAMIFSSFVIVVPVSAEGSAPAPEAFLNKTSDGTPWTNHAAESFAGGDGSSKNPYQIATAEQLALLAKLLNAENSESTKYNSKYYTLTADIDLAGHEWVAIAKTTNTTYRFLGNFEGNGRTIKNMTVTSATTITAAKHVVGLFGYVGGGKAIQNFTLTGSLDITHNHNAGLPNGMAYIGMVVAHCSGNTKIQNIDVYGKMVVNNKATNLLPVGGILGRAHSAIINNCTMNGSIEVFSVASKIPSAGGIVGTHTKALQINNCVNNADVTVYANGTNSIVGGLVAYCGVTPFEAEYATTPSNYDVTIKNSINTGTITSATNPNIEGSKPPNNQRIGGLIGNMGRDLNYESKVVDSTGADKTGVQTSIYSNVTVENCINTGIVALGEGVTLGTASGASQLIGHIEGKSLNAFKYNTSDKKIYLVYNEDNSEKKEFRAPNLTMSGCFVSGSAYNKLAAYDIHSGGGIKINEVTYPDGYYFSPGRQIAFAMDYSVWGNDVTIRVGKALTDSLLSVGSMKLTYGDFEMKVEKGNTGLTGLSVFGKIVEEPLSYAITIPAQENAVPKMSVVLTAMKGTPVEKNIELVTSDATWADLYTSELKVNPLIDPDDHAPGSAKNPYLISNAKELAMVSAHAASSGKSGLYFSIVNDIDISEHEWLPISSKSGTIYGNGHTISGLTLTGNRYSGVQAFISDSSNWEINNLTFTDVRIKTTDDLNVKNVAAVIGNMTGGTLDNVRVLSGKIDVATTTTVNVGGLVANATAGTIKNCLVNLDVNVSGEKAIVANGTATLENNNTFDFDLKSTNTASLNMKAASLQKSGMAFTATFNRDAYDALVAMGYTFEFGLLIARTEKLVELDGRVSLLKGGYVVTEYDKEIVENQNSFDGAIINIKEHLLTKDLSAVPYAILTKDGVSCTVYGDFDPDGGRNVVELAKAVMEDRSPEQVDGYQNEITFEGDPYEDKFSPYTNAQLENVWKVYGALIRAYEA